MAELLTDLTIVLPSLNPGEKFAGVVDGLVHAGFSDIVIINDGSDPDRLHWFQQAETYPAVTVLTHEVNRGKGRALKTGFEFILANRPHSLGAVTIDGDGQHLLPDIMACGQAMLDHPDEVILGCRDFSRPDVPPKSKSGNQFTAFLFRFGCGIRLSDTQTGLRAIPRKYLEPFCAVKGERFEYETNMLLTMRKLGIDFLEVPIATVYDGNNSGTHFRPILDSLKIMQLVFTFMLASLSSTAIDFGLFYLLLHCLPTGDYTVFAATVLARICSSFCNFNLNKKMVFQNSGNYRRSMRRYYCLAIPQMLVSAACVTLLEQWIAPGSKLIATLLKAPVDLALFFIAFTIQREWVFQSKTPEKKDGNFTKK